MNTIEKIQTLLTATKFTIGILCIPDRDSYIQIANETIHSSKPAGTHTGTGRILHKSAGFKG